MTSNRDRDCAFLARAALFPLQLNPSNSLPALKALTKVRNDAIAANPNLGSSSFFPKHVALVRSVGDTNYRNPQWNGQPDICDGGASFDVIPEMLSVRCMECASLRPGLDSFARIVKGADNKGGGEHGTEHREVVLCSNRLLKGDYTPERAKDLPPRFYRGVEEALAREITKVRDEIKFERSNDDDGTTSTSRDYDPACDPKTCIGLASSEIRAARAAECYFSKSGKERKRGSRLPLGFSLLPASLQQLVRDRCIHSVAMKATEKEFGGNEGRTCVVDAFERVMRERDGE